MAATPSSFFVYIKRQEGACQFGLQDTTYNKINDILGVAIAHRLVLLRTRPRQTRDWVGPSAELDSLAENAIYSDDAF